MGRVLWSLDLKNPMHTNIHRASFKREAVNGHTFLRLSLRGSGRARSENEAPGSFDAPAREGRKYFAASRCL